MICHENQFSFTTIITQEYSESKKKKVNYRGTVGKGYSKMIRYTTTRRIFSLLNRLLLIAKFNMGPKEMERNFISIYYPLNKEKRNRREQFYSVKMINIGHESSLIFKFSE